jgi:hypothetical protein
MASLFASHRSGRSGRRPSDVRLTATRPREVEPDPLPAGPRYGWQLLAIGGALATAVASWIIVAGLSVVGWLAAAPGDLTVALRTGTRLWLLAHGTPTKFGSVAWSLAPLGMSLLIAYLLNRVAAAAVRFADPDEESDALRVALITAGLCTVSYTAVVAAVGLGTGAEIGRGIIGAAIIAAVGAFRGSLRGAGFRISDFLPTWAQPVPVAVAGAIAVLLIAGVAVLTTGILLHTDRIVALAAGLGAGTLGGIALWAGQAAFLPNIVVWCTSYGLGAGFTVGQGSVVAPSEVSLGLLPAIPVLGALPGSGPGPQLALAWLASGVAAGAVAALLVVRRRPAARFDETALVGGLAGVLAALIFTGLAWTTGGDLGDGRLVGAGPRLLELLVMSTTLLGLSGMICGLVLGIIGSIRRSRAGRPEKTSDLAMETDDTVAVDVSPGGDPATEPVSADRRTDDEEVAVTGPRSA